MRISLFYGCFQFIYYARTFIKAYKLIFTGVLFRFFHTTSLEISAMRFLRYYSIFFTVIIILSSSCNSVKNENVATKGNLDLSDWNFETHGIVELNGEWSFHWEELF